MVTFTDVIEYGDYKADGVTVCDLIRVMKSRGYTEHKTAKALGARAHLRVHTKSDHQIRVVRAGNVQRVRGVRFKKGVWCPPKCFYAPRGVPSS
jgi:hypothetical protein